MTQREGSLEAPIRHPIDWKNPEYYDQASVDEELERIFNICHGCRRCVSLCNAFPTLFDLIDESKTGEIDGVAKADFGKVVDQCYLCDLCYMTKCPYVPPHPWNVDFPHLMLRAKAQKFKRGETSFRDRLLTSTDRLGKLATIPVVVQMVNKANRTPLARKAMDRMLGVHRDRRLPPYATRRFNRLAPGSNAWPVQKRRAHAGQGGDLFDLLRQLQRARHRARPDRDTRAQRDSVHDRRKGSLLRHAQAGAGRPRHGREAQDKQHAAAGGVRARRLRDPDRRCRRAR